MCIIWYISSSLFMLNYLITANAELLEANKRTAPFSFVELKNWWNLEKVLIDDFAKKLHAMQHKLDVMQNAFKIYRNRHDIIPNDLELYLSNPLNSFALINRLHADWRHWQTYANDGLDPFNLSEDTNKKLPKEIDLKAAIDALLNMQRLYRLKSEHLAEGNIGEIKVDAKLSANNCNIIGQHVLGQGHALKAIEWFQTAIKCYKPQNAALYEIYGFNRANILFKVALVYENMVNYTEALNAINTAIAYSPNNATYLSYKNFIENNLRATQTCRTQYTTKQSHLNCRYNSNTTAFLQLAPLKMEEIHLDPYIVLYHDAIYKNEIEEIKRATLPELRLGLVNENKQSLYRTTHYHTLRRNSSQTLERLHRRLVDMSGLDYSDNALIQIVNYGLGGHIITHADYLNCTVHSDICNRTGDRLATTLFYLDNVTHGGATVFPNIGASIVPEQGAAVFWYNLNNAKHGNPKTLHAACPVIVGSRWIAFKFAFERRNMFIKPCSKI